MHQGVSILSHGMRIPDLVIRDMPCGSDAIHHVSRPTRWVGCLGRRPEQAQSCLKLGEKANHVGAVKAIRSMSNVAERQFALEKKGGPLCVDQQPVDRKSHSRMFPLDGPDPANPLQTVMPHFFSSLQGPLGTCPWKAAWTRPPESFQQAGFRETCSATATRGRRNRD